MLDSVRSTSILATLVLIMTAASGCVETDPEAASADGTSSTSPSSTSSANETGNLSGNAAPVLVVSILSNGTALEAENGSYAAGVGENLTFDASNSTDADGDNLTFTWDFGDGNTSEEASSVYAFGAEGNYTVVVTVHDGRQGNASQSLNLSIGASGPAAGIVIRDQNQKFSGTYTVAVQGANCIASVQGSGASKANDFIVPETDSGANVGANKFVIKLTGGSTTLDQAFRLAGPDGKTIKDVDDGAASEELSLEGEFAAGKYTITVYGCAAVNGSWNLDVTATLVAV